jgi:hypothetical protein
MRGQAYHLPLYAATKRPEKILSARMIRIAGADEQEDHGCNKSLDSLQA